MVEHEGGADGTARARPAGEARGGAGEATPAPSDYAGPGAWGTWALVLLGGLFLVAAVATAHSILVTFGL